MFKAKAKVVNEMGIHANAASQIIKASTQFRSNIFIEYSGELINAKSIVGILAAAIPEYSSIVVSAEGIDEKEAVEKVVSVIEGLK